MNHIRTLVLLLAFTLLPGWCRADLLTSLVAYWKLDEASGNAIDAHAAFDLTEASTVGTTTGIINGSRVSDNTADRFSHADDDAFSPGDADFAFSLWFQHAGGFNGDRALLAKWAASNNREYRLWLDWPGSGSTATLRWEVSGAGLGGGGITIVDWSAAISGDTTYHVVVDHDAAGDTIGITVNSGTRVSAAHTTGETNKNGSFYLFYDDLGTDPGTGIWIDEVAYWTRILTSDERTDLYNSGAGLSYDDFAAPSAVVDPLSSSIPGVARDPLGGGRIP